MKYNIKELANLAGTSSRTLRYYDQIGLLRPKEYTKAGYRIYGTEEVDRLQQILFYKELGFSLKQIQQLIEENEESVDVVLNKHYHELQAKKTRIERQLETLAKTIAYQKGEYEMKDAEKFIGLKKEKLAEHARYQKESSVLYGQEVVNKVRANLENAPAQAFETAENIESELIYYLQKEPLSEAEQQRIVQLHQQWLQQYAPDYSPVYHRQLAHLYQSDERFQQYYDQKAGSGAAKRLSDYILRLVVAE